MLGHFCIKMLNLQSTHWHLKLLCLCFIHIFAVSHDAEQPMEVIALFVCFRSACQGALDLPGRGGAPLAALAALPLQLAVASQPPFLDVVGYGCIQTADGVVHLQPVQ